jgi:hypothetical protein
MEEFLHSVFRVVLTLTLLALFYPEREDSALLGNFINYLPLGRV